MRASMLRRNRVLSSVLFKLFIQLSNGIFKTPESNPKRALKSIAIINYRHNDRHNDRHKGAILILKNNIFTFTKKISPCLQFFNL